MFFAVKLKTGRVVAFVAIEDKEAVNPLRTAFRVPIEVLNPV